MDPWVLAAIVQMPVDTLILLMLGLALISVLLTLSPFLIAMRSRKPTESQILYSLLSRMKHPLQGKKDSIGGLFNAAEDPQNVERRKDIRRALDEELEDIDTIANAIESVTRLGSDDTVHSVNQVNVVEILDDLRTSLTPLSEEKGIKILAMRRNSDAAFYIDADVPSIRQAFSNLLENSLKYNPPGTEVHIDVTAKSNREVLVRIADNGKGIRQEVLRYIFEPQKKPSTPGDRMKGTGMGLYLCQLIVNQHGGNITARALQPGLEFYITLPMKRKTGN